MNTLKLLFSAVCAWLSAKLGILAPLLAVLFIVLIVDYLTGMISAFTNQELNSEIGLRGIFKKSLYIILVLLGLIVDWLFLLLSDSLHWDISMTTYFGILTAIWLIINELISILENLGRMGIPLPAF